MMIISTKSSILSQRIPTAGGMTSSYGIFCLQANFIFFLKTIYSVPGDVHTPFWEHFCNQNVQQTPSILTVFMVVAVRTGCFFTQLIPWRVEPVTFEIFSICCQYSRQQIQGFPLTMVTFSTSCTERSESIGIFVPSEIRTLTPNPLTLPSMES